MRDIEKDDDDDDDIVLIFTRLSPDRNKQGSRVKRWCRWASKLAKDTDRTRLLLSLSLSRPNKPHADRNIVQICEENHTVAATNPD